MVISILTLFSKSTQRYTRAIIYRVIISYQFYYLRGDKKGSQANASPNKSRRRYENCRMNAVTRTVQLTQNGIHLIHKDTREAHKS